MSIATAIVNAQNKVAAAYTACNNKGATMPASQDLANLDDCIDSIPTGGGGGGHTGTVDTAGLQALGWDSDDIQWLQDHVWWDAEDDAEWAVTEANKAFGPTGATPLTWSNYTAQKYNPDLRYFPKLASVSGNTNMYNVFGGWVHLVAIPTHGWTTSAVTNFASCFVSCFQLRSVGDISHWVTSAATQFYNMFQQCISLEEIDVSHWDTSNCTTIWQAFNNCVSLKSIDISSWSFAKAASLSNMFSGCSSLQSVTLPATISAPLVTTIQNMFGGCVSLQGNMVLNISAASLTAANGLFNGCRKLKKAKISIASTVLSNLSQICYLVNSCSEVDLTGIDTTGCANSGIGTSAAGSVLAETANVPTIKLGANFFKGSFDTLYATQCLSWTRNSIYESLYTNQTTRNSNSNAVTVKLATQAYDRLSAQDISDIATKNITLTRG